MPENDAKATVARARVLRAETVGLLLLAVLIFLTIVVRWGHFLNWRTH